MAIAFGRSNPGICYCNCVPDVQIQHEQCYHWQGMTWLRKKRDSMTKRYLFSWSRLLLWEQWIRKQNSWTRRGQTFACTVSTIWGLCIDACLVRGMAEEKVLWESISCRGQGIWRVVGHSEWWCIHPTSVWKAHFNVDDKVRMQIFVRRRISLTGSCRNEGWNEESVRQFNLLCAVCWYRKIEETERCRGWKIMCWCSWERRNF